MLKAKDIMTTEVISVRKDAPVLEAIELLAENQVTGIPVVDEAMKLVGMLTEKDVLRLYDVPERAKSQAVSEFMTQPAIYFDENEDLADVCDCLINHVFRRVPVISDGKLVGIISRPDIINYILRMYRNEQPVLA